MKNRLTTIEDNLDYLLSYVTFEQQKSISRETQARWNKIGIYAALDDKAPLSHLKNVQSEIKSLQNEISTIKDNIGILLHSISEMNKELHEKYVPKRKPEETTESPSTKKHCASMDQTDIPNDETNEPAIPTQAHFQICRSDDELQDERYIDIIKRVYDLPVTIHWTNLKVPKGVNGKLILLSTFLAKTGWMANTNKTYKTSSGIFIKKQFINEFMDRLKETCPTVASSRNIFRFVSVGN